MVKTTFALTVLCITAFAPAHAWLADWGRSVQVQRDGNVVSGGSMDGTTPPTFAATYDRGDGTASGSASQTVTFTDYGDAGAVFASSNELAVSVMPAAAGGSIRKVGAAFGHILIVVTDAPYYVSLVGSISPFDPNNAGYLKPTLHFDNAARGGTIFSHTTAGSYNDSVRLDAGTYRLQYGAFLGVLGDQAPFTQSGSFPYTLTFSDTETPEPSGLALLGAGALGLLRRKRR